MKILVLDGPNLNLLGVREPGVYGSMTLEAIRDELGKLAATLDVSLEFRQSNHEGELIDLLHGAMGRVDGVLLNPGGLTHTSVALADAIRAAGMPTIEVHLSNIFAREEFRRRSITAEAAVAVVAGFGWRSYLLALEGLTRFIRDSGDRR